MRAIAISDLALYSTSVIVNFADPSTNKRKLFVLDMQLQWLECITRGYFCEHRLLNISTVERLCYSSRVHHDQF